MKIFVINSGSSSVKFQLINMTTKDVMAIGLVERIGLPKSRLKYESKKGKRTFNQDIKDHKEGINLIVKILTGTELGVLKDMNEIYAVGHRVVHAGEQFNSTVILTDEVMTALKKSTHLAPLHNPPNIIGVEATKEVLPNTPMAGVFDTAFHQTMPPKAYIYPIPYEYYNKYRVRRYGFHGTSHLYVSKEGARLMKRKLTDLKIITCHLGNGASMAAIKYGKSIDTTMGFTPLEGLMMGTRCGDIDPAIPLFLQRVEGLESHEIDAILNRKSGVLGISMISSDMRDVESSAEDHGNLQAQLAIEMYAYKIKKYIGSYVAAMNGVDLIIFTAGIGERDTLVRHKVLEDMECFGIDFDPEINEKVFGELGTLTKPDSKVKVMVIPTNEELEIAEQTMAVVEKNTKTKK